ncbi:MAG: hypothetical protein ACK2UI_01955, partial [Anaerolineae bacterium]
MISDAINVVLPLAILAGGAFALYVIARLIPSRVQSDTRNQWLAALTAAVFALALGVLLTLRPAPGDATPAWGATTLGGVNVQADT